MQAHDNIRISGEFTPSGMTGPETQNTLRPRGLCRLKQSLFAVLLAISLFLPATGAANLPGNGIYFEFAGKYNFLANSGEIYEEVGLDDEYDKYDISFDNGKIVTAWGRRPYSQYGNDYQTFVTAPLPRPGKGALSQSYLESQKTTEVHHYHGQISAHSGTDFYISPDGKYAAIDGTHPVTDPEHPLTIIDLATGEELAAFKHSDIRGDEHRVAGWSRDNEVFFTVGKDVLKTGPALDWEAQAVIRLESSHGLAPRVNMQGTQLAFRHNYHIYVHDIPSGKTWQVTDSNAEPTTTGTPSGEYAPAFSPDGNFIAFEGRPSFSWSPNWNNLGGAFGGATVLIIVPNDGKRYDLDAANGGGAIFPKDEKGAPVFSTGRKIIWR